MRPADESRSRERSSTDWVLKVDLTAENRRTVESLTAMSSGLFGTRGLIAGVTDSTQGVMVASGAYDDNIVPAQLEGPRWTTLDVDLMATGQSEVTLDMGVGVVAVDVQYTNGARTRAEMFVSRTRPGIHGMLVQSSAGSLPQSPPLSPPSIEAGAGVSSVADNAMLVRSGRAAISTHASETRSTTGNQDLLVRLVGSAVGASEKGLADNSAQLLQQAQSIGYQQLKSESAGDWDRIWQTGAIDIPAQPALQQAIRFALFHLLSSSNDLPEVAIGARGLTGRAYRGHVFWDADVFVVPVLSALEPKSAAAALRYRQRRLGAAQARAAREGRRGARFPWESALDGSETAPTEGIDLTGAVLPIRTGQLEEHIVADVAWAVENHIAWTGDEAMRRGMGAQILLETARYWQSRVEVDLDGSAHIRGVIGPDEYHEDVDDNLFTNAMAEWNLRRAAEVAVQFELVEQVESSQWLETSDRLQQTYRSELGVHQQFKGFFDLEDVLASSIAEPPFPADALLGHSRIREVQIIKQPDVLMLHHMLPDALGAGSLKRDLDFYLPRTAHGSSLSPGITASLLAQVGRLREAVHWFELAAHFDLADISGTTSGGLHLATMGGLWQAFTQGFCGMRPLGGGLIIDPRIPAHWDEITHRVIFRSVPVRLSASPDRLALRATSPVDIRLGDGWHGQVSELRAKRSTSGWERA